jgi:hypothetical protein
VAEKTKLRSLYVIEEATFGVDPAASGVGYLYLHAEADLPKLALDMIETALQNDRLVVSKPEVGVQRASFGFKVPLRASGTPSAPPSTPAIAPEVDLLLKHLLGTVTRGQSSTVTAGGTAATINVTASGGFIVGGLVYASQDGRFYTVVTIPNGTSVTVSPTPVAPVTSGNLIAANYYTPADTGHKTLAFYMTVGAVGVTMLGCRLASAKISGVAANSRPMLEVTVEADSFAIGTKASIPVADDRFPAVRGPIVKGSPCWLAGTQTPVRDLDLDLGVQSAFLSSTEGLQGRSYFEVTARAPKGSFTAYYAAGFLTDLAAATSKTLGFAAGTTATGFGFYVPVSQWGSAEFTDAEGALAQKVEWAAYDNGAAAEIVVSVF